nr:LysR substrate-binding domain-containing protein [Burkholderia cepacia]
MWPIDNPGIDVEPFVRASAVIAMSDTHELAAQDVISFADIRDLPLVATHLRSLLRQHLERLFRAQKRTANIRCEATNGFIAYELTALRLGIALADPFVAISAGTPNLVARSFVEEIPMDTDSCIRLGGPDRWQLPSFQTLLGRFCVSKFLN